MELRQLRYFVAVAKHESFKKAAIELRIAQPALSRQIGLLEHELGTPLFTRHTRGSIPTEEGRMLVEEAEKILHLTAQAKQKLQFSRGLITGPVRLGLSPTLAEWVAPDLMELIREAHPDVHLSFAEGLTSRLRQALVGGSVDIAVLSLSVDPAHLILGTSISERISLIGMADAPIFSTQEPLALAEVAHLPLILSGIRKEGIRNIVDRALVESGVALQNVVAEVDTMFMARRMVERGLGYTLNIESAVETGLAEGRLASRAIQDLRLERVVARSAAHSPSRAVLEVSKHLTTILRARFPRQPNQS